MPNNKFIFAVLIIITIIGLYYFTNQANTTTTKAPIKKNTETNQKALPDQSNNKAKVKTKKTNEINSLDTQTITVFDDDPVVNNLIIKQKYGHCSNLFLLHQEKIVKNSYYQKLKTNKPDLYKKHLDFCQKINTEHPEFNLKNINSPLEYKPNSFLGRVLKDGAFAEAQLEDNLELFFKEVLNTDLNLLLSIYGEVAAIYALNNKFKNIVKSEQHDYGIRIGSYARKLLACRLGADCGEYSSLMFTTCLNNEFMCANNFEELIKTKFSKGQQADIELAYQHLLEYFEIEE